MGTKPCTSAPQCINNQQYLACHHHDPAALRDLQQRTCQHASGTQQAALQLAMQAKAAHIREHDPEGTNTTKTAPLEENTLRNGF
ncbi:hypothetical protein [Xylella fastidiosa]|uniref:Uncharacterized protein n=1 Tax=Xylella fastidiosa subsp. sandyi Ann-1 TaxID=155920 RepID=A0A060HCG5_XYLFS|nr:hypothetical protein [Xylella fastidiosa]AIC11076.1 hypothetical protein D934_04100 [Xylella fastidiosa subsp. sandyi Ann-1]UIX81853.1 hypothetical protein LZ756_02995 [Xylella fastidiosa subsp. sandyi]